MRERRFEQTSNAIFNVDCGLFQYSSVGNLTYQVLTGTHGYSRIPTGAQQRSRGAYSAPGGTEGPREYGGYPEVRRVPGGTEGTLASNAHRTPFSLASGPACACDS